MINRFSVSATLMRNFVLNLLNFMKVPLKLKFLSVCIYYFTILYNLLILIIFTRYSVHTFILLQALPCGIKNAFHKSILKIRANNNDMGVSEFQD